MPLKPLIHPLQRKILLNLSFSNGLRFNEIKNFPIDPRNFVYHLNVLIREQLVEFDPITAQYKLTNKGKRLASLSTVDESYLYELIHIFIGVYAIQDGNILVVKRKQSPYLGYVGIPIFSIQPNEFITETAQKGLTSLGLSGSVKNPLMIETIYREQNGEVITHSNMHVFYCDNVTGNLKGENSEGQLLWMTPKELLSQKKGYQDSKTLIEFFSSKKKVSGNTVISRIDTQTEY